MSFISAASKVLPIASKVIGGAAPIAGNIAKGIGKIFGGDIEKGVNSFVDKGMGIVKAGTGLADGISGLFSGGNIGENVNSIIKNGGGLISGISGLFGGGGGGGQKPQSVDTPAGSQSGAAQQRKRPMLISARRTA